MHIVDEIKNKKELKKQNFISIPEISKITGLYSQTIRNLILESKVPWGTYTKTKKYAFVIKRKDFESWWCEYMTQATALKEKPLCGNTET